MDCKEGCKTVRKKRKTDPTGQNSTNMARKTVTMGRIIVRVGVGRKLNNMDVKSSNRTKNRTMRTKNRMIGTKNCMNTAKDRANRKRNRNNRAKTHTNKPKILRMKSYQKDAKP